VKKAAGEEMLERVVPTADDDECVEVAQGHEKVVRPYVFQPRGEFRADADNRVRVNTVAAVDLGKIRVDAVQKARSIRGSHQRVEYWNLVLLVPVFVQDLDNLEQDPARTDQGCAASPACQSNANTLRAYLVPDDQKFAACRDLWPMVGIIAAIPDYMAVPVDSRHTAAIGMGAAEI